jgi:hypothetical protein
MRLTTRRPAARQLRAFITAIALGLASACSGDPYLAAAAAHPTTGEGKANLAVYIGFDDHQGRTDLRVNYYHALFAQTGSTPALGILMSGDTDQWWDSFRTKVAKGQGWRQDFVPLGELNMGIGTTLRDFLRWNARVNPAETTHLILHTHGGGPACCGTTIAPAGRTHPPPT